MRCPINRYRVDASASQVDPACEQDGSIRVHMAGTRTERRYFIETTIEELQQIVDEFHRRVAGYSSVGSEIARAIKRHDFDRQLSERTDDGG